MTSGLLLADLKVGREIRIGGIPYKVLKNSASESSVVLLMLNGSESEFQVPRATLHAQISDESARPCDPITNAALAAAMPPVTLGLMEHATVLRWYERMILMRGLMPYAHHSPRSAQYQRAYEDALRLFDWSRANREIKHPTVCLETRLSAKRSNALLRSWRHHGGAIASLLTQISPARRAARASAVVSAIRAIVQKTALKLPHASTSTVHRATGAAWRASQRKKGPGSSK